MNETTRKLTRAALLTAMSTAIMYLASLLPSGRLGFVAVAGLLTAVALMSCGVWWACGVFAATGLISLLLLPLKSAAVLYLAFLGYYPILKSRLERMRSIFWEWVAKLIVFNIALAVVSFTALSVIISNDISEVPVWTKVLFFISASVIFAVYDIGVSGLIAYYIEKISKYLDGKRR